MKGAHENKVTVTLLCLPKETTSKMQLVIESIIPKLLKAQHVSSGTPLIIRSSKLYSQPVYIPMW
jgi:hypothetical protein